MSNNRNTKNAEIKPVQNGSDAIRELSKTEKNNANGLTFCQPLQL